MLEKDLLFGVCSLQLQDFVSLWHVRCYAILFKASRSTEFSKVDPPDVFSLQLRRLSTLPFLGLAFEEAKLVLYLEHDLSIAKFKVRLRSADSSLVHIRA